MSCLSVFAWLAEVISCLRSIFRLILRRLFRRKVFAKLSVEQESRQRTISISCNNFQISEAVRVTKVKGKKYLLDHDPPSLS